MIKLFFEKDEGRWCGGKKQVIGGFSEMVDVELMKHIFYFFIRMSVDGVEARSIFSRVDKRCCS